jgi:hypothetical protein
LLTNFSLLLSEKRPKTETQNSALCNRQ